MIRKLTLCLCLLMGELMPLAVHGQVATVESSVEIPAINDGLPGAGPIRRADWFRQIWNSRRTAWRTRIEQDQGAVVFLGDSITQGWGDDFAQAFPGLQLANRGISGDTSRGMLIRLEEDVMALHPEAVVLLLGTNDLEENAEPATIAANLKLIVGRLKEHNAKMPIVLCFVFPSSASKHRSAANIQEVNRLYAQAVRGDAQITVVDTWTLFANETGDAKAEEFPDLLHPNQAGYAKWALALRPVFATLGLLETEVEPFELEPGFESLFNGHDLSGWGFRPSSEEDQRAAANWRKSDLNAPPWPIVTTAVGFEGKSVTPDGRYLAKNGRLVVTTPPEGRKIQQLWTTQEFDGDFVLRLEFRATPNADSGIFIRKPQLQCRDFWLAGPYKELKQYQPQQWNSIEITVKQGVAFCTCNGEVLETEFKVPATGPIGLEGDRGQLEYRRIRWKRL